MKGSLRLVPVLAAALVMLAAAGVEAAIQWSSASGALSTGTTPTTLQLAAGAGASKTRYLSTFALSANKTYFTGSVVGRAGADVVVKDVVHVSVANGTTQTVTLGASRVTNANVQALTWTVYNGTTLVGTLDALSATPSVSFSLPTGSTFQVDLRLKLAAGAGLNNAPATLTLGVSA